MKKVLTTLIAAGALLTLAACSSNSSSKKATSSDDKVTFHALNGDVKVCLLYTSVVTAEDGITPNRPLFWILDKIVSIGRAFPFIILLAAIAPLTKILVGTPVSYTHLDVYKRQTLCFLECLE